MIVAPLTDAALTDALPALARLRMHVFRDFPYLYDGTEEYERTYLATFAQSRDAVIVAAQEGDRIVGCATASALATNYVAVVAPLQAAGIDIETTFYFGESVLAADYRGRGVGHAFFDQREARARACGAKRAAFCAVIREENHPRRPYDYRPLDAFWMARGYSKLSGVICRMAWKDLDEDEESEKPMQFWLREL